MVKKQKPKQEDENATPTITNVMDIEPTLAVCSSCHKITLCHSYPESTSFVYYCLKCRKYVPQDF